jgi:hypothetical protein
VRDTHRKASAAWKAAQLPIVLAGGMCTRYDDAICTVWSR